MSVVRLRVTWDGHAIAGVSRLTPLSRSTAVIEHRDGADPEPARKLPGRTSYAPVVLEREVTDDRDFATWAETVTQERPDGTGAGDSRKDLHIELFDEAGEVILAYTLYRAWVSAYQAVAVPEVTQYPVAMETITVEFEGWERHPPASWPADVGCATANPSGPAGAAAGQARLSRRTPPRARRCRCAARCDRPRCRLRRVHVDAPVHGPWNGNEPAR